jgi:hypothetical protein
MVSIFPFIFSFDTSIQLLLHFPIFLPYQQPYFDQFLVFITLVVSVLAANCIPFIEVSPCSWDQLHLMIWTVPTHVVDYIIP